MLPERHVERSGTISEFPPDEAKRMLEFVADTAAEAGLDDYRVIVNVGTGAGQTVFHLHWHILGGALGAGGMSLIARMEDELKAAMTARDDERRDTLRLMLAALRAAEKELQRPLQRRRGAAGAPARAQAARRGGGGVPRGGGRDEQADEEDRELAVLEEFMPEPLSEEEIEEIVDDAIAEVGATSMRDLGRVMADVMPQVAGRADGSAVSQLVREKLA